MKRRLLTLSLLSVPSLSLVAQSFKPVNANPAARAIVQACISNPQCTVLVVTIGGVAYHQLTQYGQTRWIPLAPMLDDPEETKIDWWDYIWADSLQEAERKCREYAARNGVEYVRTTKPTSRLTGKRYECHVRG